MNSTSLGRTLSLLVVATCLSSCWGIGERVPHADSTPEHSEACVWAEESLPDGGSARAEVAYLPAANALGPYSSAVVVGDLALLSGKIGERGQSFAHEVETCLDAVENTLASLGLSFADVVEARVYLTDMERYAEFNEIYGRRLSAPYPARTCVAVAALPGGARVEVQVAARR